MRRFLDREGFQFLDDRELELRSRWFHYSTPEVFTKFFRSPDWPLWQNGQYDDAIVVMLGDLAALRRNTYRHKIWAERGVKATRVQVVEPDEMDDPANPVNYLVTYLAVTHPGDDHFLVDADKCAALGIDLPDLDFHLHDDDLVMTKYEGEPGVLYREAYFNLPPARDRDPDDRQFFDDCRTLAEVLLRRRAEVSYTGPLPGLALLRQAGVTITEGER